MIFCNGFFNSLPNSKYLALLILAVFSNSLFSGKTRSLAINSYYWHVLMISRNLSSLSVWNCIGRCVALSVSNYFDFLARSHFIISSSEILMDYLMVKLYRSLKMRIILQWESFLSVNLHNIFKLNVRWIIQRFIFEVFFC